MASFRTRLSKWLGAAVGTDRVYTRLAAEQFHLTRPAQLAAACDSLPPGDLAVGVAACALAEQGHFLEVFVLTKKRLPAALEAESESNEAFMLGKAVVMCGEDSLPLIDELSVDRDSKVRRWALVNYGFLRSSDAALKRLIVRARTSNGEELRTILFSMSQHGSIGGCLEILEMLPRLPTETRIAASRFLMSFRINKSLQAKAQMVHDSEQVLEVKRNLQKFLLRF